MRRYGWKPDVPSIRDWRYRVTNPVALPDTVDLTPQMPPVYDQGDLGSCTANAIGAALQFARMKKALPDFIPSRLFIYYNERVMEGTIQSDAGAAIRDGVQSVATQGDIPETEWPYDISQFATQPPQALYDAALFYTSVVYQRIDPDLNLMRACLAGGDPFVIGFSVYDAFESGEVASTGIVLLPKPDEKCLGGHAVLVVGYDDAVQRFRVRNSWGIDWGQSGYFEIPYAYLTNTDLADDSWKIELP